MISLLKASSAQRCVLLAAYSAGRRAVVAGAVKAAERPNLVFSKGSCRSDTTDLVGSTVWTRVWRNSLFDRISIVGAPNSETTYQLPSLSPTCYSDVARVAYSCRNKRTKLAIKKRRKRMGERISLRYR